MRLVALMDLAASSHRTAILVLTIATLLAVLPGFFGIPPVDRDEALFAQISKQMVETSDYVDIRFQDQDFYKKPAGINWLQAGAVQVAVALGMPPSMNSIWVYRIPSLLGALAASLLAYWAALAFVGRQPALLALLASGYSPVYPCHVPPREMRQHPIGTGPFKFVEFRPNESIKVVRNPNYWKPDRPYLDGIEYTIISSRSTAILGFIAGKLDMTFPYVGLTIPLLKEVKSQMPQAVCETRMANAGGTLIVNRDKPPFDNPDLRRALALSVDRKGFIDILTEGQGKIGGAMMPPPDGVWGLPPDMLKPLPGYDPDIQKNRAEAREIMHKLGYGPNKRLGVKVSTRDISYYRDPAVILIDQLKEIYMDGELEPVETTQWYPKVMRKDYTVGLNITETGVDDPDVLYNENYVCGAARNYTGYCNPQVDKLVEQQSIETDSAQRKKLVWEVEKKLVEDDARPIIYFQRGATCWQPQLKGLTIMVNSIYNGSRYEDLWLDN